MSQAKRILYTVAASFAVGAVAGMLFAPDEGVETRKKLKKLKRKISRFGEDHDRKTLEELKESLQAELDVVNEKLEQQ